MLTIEFFFDVASPYSYLASTQVDAVGARAGVPVRWRPFLLGGVFKATSNQPPASTAARGAFGAPTLFVGDEMFFGNDRLHFVEAAARRG